jgi:2-methylcitrate dehydratase PrpD
MTRDVESEIAEFITGFRYDDLADSHVETIVRAVVDTVGVTVAGAGNGGGKKATEQAGLSPAAADAGELLGVSEHQSPEERALRVGTAGHALDYDDLSWGMDGHPSVTLVPPIFSLVPEVDPSGKEVVAAFGAGFETECAIAQPVSPSHYEAGWHATATFGTFGATAAAAHLLGLDAEAVETALNIAASMPSGLKRNFGSMTKPLHAGLCARSGVTAARLAGQGFTAGDAVISGDRGFWDRYGIGDRGAFSIGERFHLDEDGIHTKAYPCCYFTHTAIAAALELGEGLDAAEVERVHVEAAPGAGDALTNPDPTTDLEAKFSMEYPVASALVHGEVGLETFTESALEDTAVRRLGDRVDFVVDETLPYDSHEAFVRIETADAEYERRRHDPPGTHDDPLSDDELRAKFDECAGTVLGDAEVERLYDACAALPAQESVGAALSGN